MAAEPEKRIEESLHAYARKRREDAGAPLEMHPAARRMLQGEVAKLKPAQPPERRAWWQGFFLIWPRFAAAVGMFAVLAVSVWVFTQSETRRSNETGQVASRAAEGLAKFDNLERLKDRTEAPKEIDALALSVEEAGKKLAEKRLVRDLDESRVQLRDMETAPAPTAPAPIVLSEVARQNQEKQVAVRYDAPAQQPIKLGDTLLAGSADDKSVALLKQRTEGGRSYRVRDGRFVQLADSTAKENLGVYSSSAITSSVTLEAGKPADNYYFAFQFPQTNFVGLFDDGAQQRLNLEVTNALLGFDVGTYAAGGLVAPASGPIALATELAANREILARNEFTRERGLQPVNEVEALVVGDKFERRDGVVAPAFLQKFELQQHANGRISIHDADGTVYEGEILAAKTDSDTGNKAKAENELRDANRRLARGDALAAAPPAGVLFRASGTNRNRELVVINGELLREEDQLRRAAALTAKNVGDSAVAVAEPATGLPVPSAQPALNTPGQAGANTRAPARFGEPVSAVNTSATVFVPAAIRGRVQIGKTNQLELRAIRSR